MLLARLDVRWPVRAVRGVAASWFAPDLGRHLACGVGPRPLCLLPVRLAAGAVAALVAPSRLPQYLTSAMLL